MKGCTAIVLAVMFVMAPCASAAVKAQALELKAGEVSVTVRTHDGKVLPRAELTLQDTDGEVFDTFVCDKEGRCTITGIEPGSYELVVAGKAKLLFTVGEKAEVDTVLVVLPAPVKYAAGDAKKAFAIPTLLTFIIGAAVVATGVVVATSGGGGGGGGHP